MILAHKTISNKISMEIRKFLWRGGKVQNKKFHLVKWATVKASKLKWGLRIRDPEKMNKDLGSKMVWRMASGGKDWWKVVIRKKYIRNPKSKIVNHPSDGKGTSFWQLCKNSQILIQNNFYWIPSNDKKIKVWAYRILGHRPLSTVQGL